MWQAWINQGATLSAFLKCVPVGALCFAVYAQRRLKLLDESDLLFDRLIKEIYARYPFYGGHKMVVFLTMVRGVINRNRAHQLTAVTNWADMTSGSHASHLRSEHNIYLRFRCDLPIVRPRAIWSTDIATIRLAHDLVYLLIAIMGWCSRQVLGRRICSSTETVCRVDPQEDALCNLGRSKISARDQGAQPAGGVFITLLPYKGIVTRRDRRGPVFHNVFVERLRCCVKRGDVYPKNYVTVGTLLVGSTVLSSIMPVTRQ